MVRDNIKHEKHVAVLASGCERLQICLRIASVRQLRQTDYFMHLLYQCDSAVWLRVSVAPVHAYGPPNRGEDLPRGSHPPSNLYGVCTISGPLRSKQRLQSLHSFARTVIPSSVPVVAPGDLLDDWCDPDCIEPHPRDVV